MPRDTLGGVPLFWLRRALAADLALFALATFFLAAIPPTTLILPEMIVMAVSAFAFVGVISHAARRVHLPGEQWAYMACGVVGAVTLFAYLSTSGGEPMAYRVSIALYLASGTVGGYAAHLVDGGRRAGAPK
jgi:hypothetical protein